MEESCYIPIREIFGNHVTVRPSAPQVYRCKITQPRRMATQMQLEVILEHGHPRLVKRKADKTKESIKTKTERGNWFFIRVVYSFAFSRD